MASPVSAICIVSHAAYGAITGGRDGHAGGVERQTAMLAQWLAARGHVVSLIVWHEGQPADTTIDGVRVIAVCRRDEGLRGMRFFHPRWTSLTKALRAAEADVYYHNCAEAITGQVALWCRRNRRGFVYSVASDPECDRRLPALRHARERLLFRYGLRHADRIIVQTGAQQAALRAGFRLDAMPLPMPCPGPADEGYRAPDPFGHATPRFVWVGRVSAEKRLDWLVDVADSVPEATFEVAGACSAGDHSTILPLARASAAPNISMLGKVARTDMPGVYRDAAALICTSAYEGFPNTFLEAWSHGVPVISTIDPDGLIARHGLGIVAGTREGLTAAVRTCLRSRESWLEMSSRAREYYLAHHTPERVLPLFEEVLVNVAGSARRASRS
jgi:glycosyltransferase involved in cell wall biosynthesis